MQAIDHGHDVHDAPGEELRAHDLVPPCQIRLLRRLDLPGVGQPVRARARAGVWVMVRVRVRVRARYSQHWQP